MDFIFGFSRKLCFCYELKFKRKPKHCVFCTGTINSEKTKPAKLRICLVQAQPFCPINQLGISLNRFTDNDSQKLIFFFFVLTRSYAALRAADLDWIVGPGYSLGRVHSGEKP